MLKLSFELTELAGTSYMSLFGINTVDFFLRGLQKGNIVLAPPVTCGRQLRISEQKAFLAMSS